MGRIRLREMDGRVCLLGVLLLAAAGFLLGAAGVL